MLGNKGMMLEKLINRTLKFYEKNAIGLFHKKKLPINFSGIKKVNNKLEIKKGWIESKSTTDYYGVFRGKFVAFEAKSTKNKSLPLTNIHDHQIRYLNKVEKFGGISFYIFGFTTSNLFFLLKNQDLNLLKKNKITIEFVKKYGYEIDFVYPGIIDFTPILEQLL